MPDPPSSAPPGRARGRVHRGGRGRRLLPVAAVLVGVWWWGHRMRHVEMARFDGADASVRVTYVHHRLLGVAGVGGIWCDVRTGQGRIGRWLEGPASCDMMSDWCVEVRPMPDGIEIFKWRTYQEDAAESFRFRGITGPHAGPPFAGGQADATRSRPRPTRERIRG